ncbi:MAG: hypothetical protein E6J17_01845 [Chloroflexi bacterium]|nr:MAG: hypothetical protein E6J17_01845 [Chloroflexota bacterium]
MAGKPPGDDRRRIELSPDELRLLGTAVTLLVNSLGREEADELEEAKALLVKLGHAGSSVRDGGRGGDGIA